MQTASAAALRDGEALTRVEFERRYAAMPDARAELIEGVVHVASPTKSTHAAAHSILDGWANKYAEQSGDALVLTNVSYRLDERNELQPDLVLMRDPERDGRA